MKTAMMLEDAMLIIKNIIHDVNGMPVDQIKSDNSLISDLAMDSVELIDFIIRLEEFDVTLKESQLSNELTVGQVAKILVQQ